MYSSIYVIQDGMRKPLWYYEKNNIKVINIPYKKVKLISGEKILEESISSTELFRIINNRIERVKKDTYRQDEIIALWKNKLDINKDYTISKWKFTITSGGYIRYLANQMGGCCYDIERISYHDT
jgi:predicted KAP-like P-loop ATPase